MRSACTLVAALALAQAGPAQLSSAAKQAQGSHADRTLPPGRVFPSFRYLPSAGNYGIDDGTAEDSIGLPNGGDLIVLTEFPTPPVPGQATVDAIFIAWGSPLFPDPSLNGLSYTAVLWEDSGGNGNPADAVVLATAPGVVSQAGTDTFIQTNFNVIIPTANFFIGFLIHHNAGQAPAALDETPPTFSGRSYIAGGAIGDIHNLNNNDLPVTPIENYGPAGNWLIHSEVGRAPLPLWYNGDFNGVNGLPNEQDTLLGAGQYAHTYDDFIVSDAMGWDVTSVYSNNLLDTNVIGATWEIRQGLSAGNGGTIIAQGMTTTPSVSQTGRSGFGFTEYTVGVLGLNLHLPADTNHYWLNVTPIGDLTGRSFASSTSGSNALGQPPGNNQNAFFDSPFFGAVFQSTADQGQPYDFSMGVGGTVTAGSGDLTLESAVSRKRHGAAGAFDLPLPLTGAEGIESRDGGNDSIYLTFNNNLTGAGSVTSSCGSASVSLDPDDPKNLIVTVLGGSCNAINITITVDGVTDIEGNTASVTLTYGKLIGDVDASGVVDFGDRDVIRAVAPSTVDSSNSATTSTSTAQ